MIPEDCGYFVCIGSCVAFKKCEENNKQGLTRVSSTQRKEGEQEVVPASCGFSWHLALSSGGPTMERNKGLMPWNDSSGERATSVCMATLIGCWSLLPRTPRCVSEPRSLALFRSELALWPASALLTSKPHHHIPNQSIPSEVWCKLPTSDSKG